MKTILIIAVNTFMETIRNKVLYNVLLVAGVVLVLSISFGDLSVFSRVQVMTDFGLATLSITGLLLSIFIGIGMLGMEITNKTVYGILTKPVTRSSFIIGKFSGLLAVLLLNFALITLFFLAVIHFMGGAVHFRLLSAVLLIAVEMAVIISASIFFSSFTTPTLAAIFTAGFYIAGHLNDLMSIGADQQNNPVWKFFLNTFYYVIPNLEHFNIRTRIVYDLHVSSGYIAWAAVYGVLFTVLFLLLSTALFSRKDL